ncbi:MAG: sel1 repeat family protein, partial [Ignavibacteriae bacterium]|nr:sel1 repeat family protein [Ignavibacteriota bacterium]
MQKKNLLSAMECVISLLIAGGACAVAQTRPNSPVFKDYKPAGPTKIIEQSDATYQMWQGFMLTQKANAGDVLAQHELGIRYFVGRGFKADTLKAGYWIQKAAGRNLIPAQYNLAILQYNGWGVAWNPFDAFRNFLYCAEEKTVEADYVLGQFFSDNLVVPRNLDEAYRRVKIAADVGHETAKEVLKEFEKRGYVPKKDSVGNEARETASDTLVTPNVSVLGGMPIFLDFDDDTSHQVEDLTLLREAVRDGSPELRKALGVESPTGDLTLDSVSLRTIELSAEAGSPEALAVLGRLLEKGIQVGADKVAAGVYYIRAIRLGSPRASALLWRLIQEKEFFPLLKSRVGQGDPDAQVVWAGLLALGLDYQVTEAQAIQLLQAAAERNHVQAMIELGLCYYVGRWVPQDVERSLEW